MIVSEREKIINKLNKLKAFIERDCGNETINAQNIADALIAKYDITSSEFSYVHFSEKTKHDAQRAQAEAKWYEYKRQQAENELSFRVSYTSCMKDVVIALCSIMNIRYITRGGQINIFCSAMVHSDFIYRLADLKKVWSASVKAVNNEMIRKMYEAHK